MSVLQECPRNNDLPPSLSTKNDPFGVVAPTSIDSAYRKQEDLSFRNDFTREHSLPGTRFDLTEVPGIF
jgi:hypothetical protein